MCVVDICCNSHCICYRLRNHIQRFGYSFSNLFQLIINLVDKVTSRFGNRLKVLDLLVTSNLASRCTTRESLHHCMVSIAHVNLYRNLGSYIALWFERESRTGLINFVIRKKNCFARLLHQAPMCHGENTFFE